jgi:hypothetical protein
MAKEARAGTAEQRGPQPCFPGHDAANPVRGVHDHITDRQPRPTRVAVAFNAPLRAVGKRVETRAEGVQCRPPVQPRVRSGPSS